MSIKKTRIEDEKSASFFRSVRTNIRAALKVGGYSTKDGKIKPLTDTAVQQKTGIARSTIRTLRTVESDNVNPDFGTLKKLANSLGVPLAFLLMTGEDWELIFKSFGALNQFAIDPSQPKKLYRTAETAYQNVHRALDEGKAFQQKLHISYDQADLKSMNDFNESLSRMGGVIGALLLSSHEKYTSIEYIALAAALANQININHK